MKLITQIKDSIYNPNYYKLLPSNERLKSSIKYLAKLSLLVSLLSAIIFSFQIPVISKGIKIATSSLVTQYPDDLIVSVKNGTTSINRPDAYVVPVGDSFKNKFKGEEFPYNNFIVIDTNQPFSLEEFKTYSTAALLTKTELVTLKNSTGQIQILPLSKNTNLEITKSWIIEKQAKVSKLLPIGMLVLAIFIFVALFIANFIGTLVTLFFYALIIWFIAMVKKMKLSYKNSYKIGIHAMTLLVVLSLFSRFLGPLNNSFFRAIILIVIVYINFFKNFTDTKKTKEPEDSTQTTKIVN